MPEIGEKFLHKKNMTKKSLNERIAEADERGNRYLAEANAADETGDRKKADELYAKGQYWLDRSNKLRGNS